MACRRVAGITAQQVRELWRRYETGESVTTIARALQRPDTLVRRALDRTGGIRPRERSRSKRVLSTNEREEISRGIAAGLSMCAIARVLGRAPSTIGREIERNGGRSQYRAVAADRRAWRESRRPKPCRLATNGRLRKFVAQGLASYQSPEQISAELVRQYPADESMRVSHETIYRTLFVQARGALKKELVQYLRTGRLRRRPHSIQKIGGGSISGELSIRERPAEVEDRAVPGHWEGDLLCGSRGSQIATLVERRSRFVMLVKLQDKNSVRVADELAKQMQRLPAELRRSLTWDRGIEMAAHQRFSLASEMQVYFCDPYSPWQRGSNENTNGLLRQFFPKRTDLSAHTQAELDRVATLMNTRPRKTLGWLKPYEVLGNTVGWTPRPTVASTG
jgi:IS30 family transposase